MSKVLASTMKRIETSAIITAGADQQAGAIIKKLEDIYKELTRIDNASDYSPRQTKMLQSAIKHVDDATTAIEKLAKSLYDE